jgi:hypothetical protein
MGLAQSCAQQRLATMRLKIRSANLVAPEFFQCGFALGRLRAGDGVIMMRVGFKPGAKVTLQLLLYFGLFFAPVSRKVPLPEKILLIGIVLDS